MSERQTSGVSRVLAITAVAGALLATGALATGLQAGTACGHATAVDRTAPLGRAVPVRDLLWIAVYPFERGHPTKAIVMAQRAIKRRFTLRGWDCSSGDRLRFWYRNGLPFVRVPVTTAALRRTGSLSATFGPWQARAMRGGYLMFWHQGLWKIAIYEGGRKLGVAIVRAAYP